MALRILLCVFAAIIASTVADGNIKLGENTKTLSTNICTK